jgi:hypothetical protein
MQRRQKDADDAVQRPSGLTSSDELELLHEHESGLHWGLKIPKTWAERAADAASRLNYEDYVPRNWYPNSDKDNAADWLDEFVMEPMSEENFEPTELVRRLLLDPHQHADYLVARGHTHDGTKD